MAPDYWAYSPFDKPQFTSSACSIASVTMALNGLRGLRRWPSQQVLTQERVLADVGSRPLGGARARRAATASPSPTCAPTPGGHWTGTAWPSPRSTCSRPSTADAAAVARVRAMLTANEQTAGNVTLAYFNQGVLTGDWNGPHVSVIGAYDASTDRVLILDVDQEWYVPYWSPVEALARALVKPRSEEPGGAGRPDGRLIRVSR